MFAFGRKRSVCELLSPQQLNGWTRAWISRISRLRHDFEGKEHVGAVIAGIVQRYKVCAEWIGGARFAIEVAIEQAMSELHRSRLGQRGDERRSGDFVAKNR